MSEPTPDDRAEHIEAQHIEAEHIEQALSQVQRLERDEREADMERTRRSDDVIVRALSDRDDADS